MAGVVSCLSVSDTTRAVKKPSSIHQSAGQPRDTLATMAFTTAPSTTPRVQLRAEGSRKFPSRYPT